MFSVTKDKQHLYSRWYYATTFFGIVDLMTILPWYIQLIFEAAGHGGTEVAEAFRIMRLFRLFEMEHFVTAFTVLDNVFRRSSGIFAATGLMALAIWVASASLFYMFEHNNPNWCAEWQEPRCEATWDKSCVCASLTYFDSIPDAMYLTAIFLGGEWAVTDFTIPGKILCMLLCVIGIALYAIPVSALFESFGAVLEGGLDALDEDEDDDA